MIAAKEKEFRARFTDRPEMAYQVSYLISGSPDSGRWRRGPFVPVGSCMDMVRSRAEKVARFGCFKAARVVHLSEPTGWEWSFSRGWSEIARGVAAS